MVSQHDLDTFLARVRRHGGRMSQLATGASADLKEALLSALTELEMMYEDLVVADEELRVQGEELRASQATLAATRSRYAELFVEAPVAYLVTTGDGIILESNRAAAELLGNPARGGVGKPLAVYLDMASRPEVRRTMLAVWRDGGVGAMDVVLAVRGRRRTDAVLTVSRAVDGGGIPTALRWGVSRPGGGSAQAGSEPRTRGDDDDAFDAPLLGALFADTSIGLLTLDGDLRVQRASAALRGDRPVAGSRLETVLPEGAEAVRQLALACLRSGRSARAEVGGRTLAEPERPRRWAVSAHPLAAPDASGAIAVGCLLIDLPTGDGSTATGSPRPVAPHAP